jgi:hypothetical protein
MKYNSGAMITLKSCPVCARYNIVPYKKVSVGSLVVEILSGVKIETTVVASYWACQECHLIFQNPRLSDQELDIYYSSGYYRRTINPPPEGMDKGEENRAYTDAGIIKQYVGDVISHLDIGCGRGYLLEAVGAGVKVGTESDTGYVRAKGVKVYSELDKVFPKKFDLVTSIHVLEHVPHPLDYLRAMAKFIGKDGYLVIEVPSLKTLGGPLGFAHLSYFEPDVLRMMCRGVGLRVLETKFTPHLLLICKLAQS